MRGVPCIHNSENTGQNSKKLLERLPSKLHKKETTPFSYVDCQMKQKSTQARNKWKKKPHRKLSDDQSKRVYLDGLKRPKQKLQKTESDVASMDATFMSYDRRACFRSN